MMGPSFPFVLEQARRGDHGAFAAIWRDIHPGLLRYLGVVAGENREDVASEVWAQVATSLDRFTGDEQGFRTWVFTTARRRAIDWHRRSARRPAVYLKPEHLDVSATSADASVGALESISTDAAIALIRSLPAAQAEVVMLRVVAGLDVARVAEIVGKQPGAVRVLAHRGLRSLAEQFAGAALQGTVAQ